MKRGKLTQTPDKTLLRNGDILLCQSNGWLGKTIKAFTKSRYNHAAMVLEVSGVLMVIDSQRKGTNLQTFENWVKKYAYNYHVARYLFGNAPWGKRIRARAFSKTGATSYDFSSLIFWQPWYLITGKWRGRKAAKAAKRMYCSEYVAWNHELPDWWAMSPQGLFLHLVDDVKYTFL